MPPARLLPRFFALWLLVPLGCAGVPLRSDPESKGEALLEELDRGEARTALTPGMKGVFRDGLAAFGEELRKSHGKLESLRLVEKRGEVYDLDAFYSRSPFPEHFRLVFDDAGRLAGFWYHGAGSGLATKAELDRAFAALPGKVSAFAQAAERRDVSYGFRADVPQPVASQVKVLLLAKACADIGRGVHRLDERLALPAEARGIPSCVLCQFEPGLEPSLRDVLHLLISASDNTAADLLLRVLGTDAVTAFAEAHGVKHVPPLVTTRGLFALECGLGPLRRLAGPERGPYLERLGLAERLEVAEAAARDGFAGGPERFGERCSEVNATAEARRAVAHVVDWPMRADELVALYAEAQRGELDTPEASACFREFMGHGGSGPLPLGGRFAKVGAKNGIETDVRSLGLLVESDRGPIAVSLSSEDAPEDRLPEVGDELAAGARTLVEYLYAQLPPKVR